VLIIKWSNEDPNPVAKDREDAKAIEQIRYALDKKKEEEEPLYYYQGDNGELVADRYPSTLFPNQYPISTVEAYHEQYEQYYRNYIRQQQKAAKAVELETSASAPTTKSSYGNYEPNYNYRSILVSTFLQKHEISQEYQTKLISGGFYDLELLKNVDAVTLDSIGIVNPTIRLNYYIKIVLIYHIKGKDITCCKYNRRRDGFY
jgi:hypothetical protein